jgi:hypothetical protein
MAFVDDVKAALEQGAHAGAAALSTAGKDLTGDVERFVIPHLADVAVHVASIVEKRAAGIYTDVTAKNLLDSQRDSVEILVETIVTLVVLEVQNLVNAIWAAVASVINGKLGFSLIPTG